MPTLRLETLIDIDGSTSESFPLVRRLSPPIVFATTALITTPTSPGFYTPTLSPLSVLTVFAVTADQAIILTFGGSLFNVNPNGYVIFVDMNGLPGGPQIETFTPSTTVKYLAAGN